MATANAIEERVARRELDIGLVYTPVMDPSVGVEQVGTSNVVCAVPRRSRLAKQKEVTAQDLAKGIVVATDPRRPCA